MTFQQILEHIGMTPRSYSGRGMYGATCVALVPEGTEFQAVADLIRGIKESFLQSRLEETLDQVADVLEKTKVDSMGRGVVLYWPKENFEGESNLDCDDDE
jgi:hypothetical protein